MILDSEEVVLNETQDVDEIITEYCLLQSGQSPTSSTIWYTIDNLPTYIDNVGGTQYVYWMRQTINGYTNDPEPAKKTLISTQLKDNGLTASGKTAAMVRQYGAGVLVCRKGKTVGALVNADGSFDVVEVEWSGDTPTAGDVLASYGSKAMVMKDGNRYEYLRMEDLVGQSGKTLTETAVAWLGTNPPYFRTEHSIYSLTSVKKKSDSTDITSSCTFNSGSYRISVPFSLVSDNEKFVIKYVSKDTDLKAFTFGDRKGGSKGALSMSIGTGNVVYGDTSTAIGRNNTISGNYSLAEGAGNTVAHDGAAAIGSLLTTGRDDQLVIGYKNVRTTDKLFVIGNDGQNIFTVAEDGQIVARTSDGEYYTLINRSSDHKTLYIRNFHYYLDGDTYKSEMVSGLYSHATGLAINGQDLFYQAGSSITLNPTTPYTAYVTESSTTIRITIPVDKSLRYISSIQVTKMIGAIIGPNGYLNLPGTTSAGSHQTNWVKTSVTINADKINNYAIRVELVGSSAFYNTTNNRPHAYIPSYGGIVFSFS
jgi:hypothetical protein